MRTSVPDAIAAMETVALDDLNAAAGLLTRRGAKYLLALPELTAFLEVLPGRARVLEIDGRRAFGYESIYFDTPQLTCYLAAARRRPNRFKVRTRRYTDSGLCFLELKTRDRRGNTVKERRPCEAADLGRLGAGGRVFVERTEEAAACAGALAPRLASHYTRTTFLAPSGGSRVTVDTGLSVRALGPGGESGPAVDLGGFAIVETKRTRGPTSIDRLLWQLGHRPLKLSKYCTGLAVVERDLPANRWRPALARLAVPPGDGYRAHLPASTSANAGSPIASSA